MSEDQKTDNSITFHLIKTPGYETHHVDGVVGGMTPTGGAFLAFYVERGAIPTEITFAYEGGALGDIINIEGREGMVREIQTGILLDEDTLRVLALRIDSVLKEMEKLK